MKPVMVTVRSIQRDADGEDTVIELVSQGSYYERNGVKYIIYNESAVTGMEGVKTTIKIYPSSVIILRTGKIKVRHQYVLDRTDEALIETPLGELQMSIRTHELDIAIEDGRGHLHLGYDISFAGSWGFYNQLQVTLREENE